MAIVICSLSIACRAPSSQSPEPSQAATAVQTGTTQVRAIMLGESFTPRTTDADIRAFVPEIAPMDSGGECSVTRTGGNGATMVTAFFPGRTNAHTSATFNFDSAGHLIRYSERRGDRPPVTTAGMTTVQRDSALRVSMSAARSTMISLDYGMDRGMVTNSGGGRPTDAVMGTVRLVESLEKLGPLTTRIARIRRYCGV